MSTYDTFDDDALAKFINDFIDGMPAHRRGYPDTYARRMAEGIRGLLRAEAAEQGEATARPRSMPTTDAGLALIQAFEGGPTPPRRS